MRGDLPPGRHAVEFAAVVLRAAYGMAFDGPLPLLSVEFAHPHPGDHQEHERVLGCPVRDVATRCGFSGSRALIRTFRRWTGSTPAAYREGTHTATSRFPESSRT